MMFIFYFSFIPYLLYLMLRYRNALYMLQQNSYNVSNRYIKWIDKNYSKVFSFYDLLFLFFSFLYYLVDINFFCFLFFLVYLFLFVIELKKNSRITFKKPFVVTSRIKRLVFTLFFLFTLISIYVVYNFSLELILVYYILYAFLGYFSYISVYFANIINKPIEKIVYYYYKNKALKKLENMDNLIKIGITGSYGKTTSKNILNDILNIHYNSFATPKSFNTPYGLMNSINNNLDKFDEVFIAEMGACKLGDIKELCDFIKPKYAIITKIGMAHLETFKKVENTVLEKFRLIESLPKDGLGILNADDSYQVNYQIKNNCDIKWIGIDNYKKCDLYAKNIKITSNGMSFDVIDKNKCKYSFTTTLLGRANIYNILAAILLGNSLGIDISKMKRVVSNLKPVEHRLELKKIDDLIIIDDAFNSNPEGANMALDVLNLMNGIKIIVTPGMIELGNLQYELNFEFGQKISKVCDYVILIGEKQTKPIYEGLINNNYKSDKIFILNDFKDAFPLINSLKKKDTCVLLENDLPDIFNENKK